MLHLTRNLNQALRRRRARARLADLGIPLKKKAGKLSGGQQSQLALTLALARRPRLLILDEPLAALDPLARQDFLDDGDDRDDRRRRLGAALLARSSPSLSGSPTTSSCSSRGELRWRARSTTCSPGTGC